MRRSLAIAAIVATLVSGAGLVAASATGSAPEGVVEGPLEIELTIRHSRFIPGAITVPAGTEVRFVVDNTDPINHELIVGDQAAQDRHEAGAEAHHATVPGEVSVAANDNASTTYVFDTPGTVLMGCHLPGHWSYGMQGTISVV